MSVLACNRNNCKNIMCDRYSKIYGYICYECFEELINNGIKTDIYKFMNSPKKIYNSSKTIFEKFDKIFPL